MGADERSGARSRLARGRCKPTHLTARRHVLNRGADEVADDHPRVRGIKRGTGGHVLGDANLQLQQRDLLAVAAVQAHGQPAVVHNVLPQVHRRRVQAVACSSAPRMRREGVFG